MTRTGTSPARDWDSTSPESWLASMGGDITLTSVKGQGSQFVLTPLAREP